MKQINVLAVCSQGSDGTSFYRGLGPLLVLEKQAPEIKVTFTWMDNVEYDANRLRTADVLFIQRPSCRGHVNLMVDAKETGIPTWVDYDDNVFDIPASNPMKYIYDQTGVLQAAAECLKMADVVTVTNQALADVFKQFNENVIVIPNAFDDYAFGHSKKPYGKEKSQQKTVLWRGASGHDYDLLAVVGSLKQHIEKYPDWHWVFFGPNPWMLTKDIPKERMSLVPWSGLMQYFKNINRLQADLMIVPLVDFPFNRSKSNIAWIEGSYGNSAILAPDWDDWQKPGVTNYQDRASFHNTLDSMLGTELHYHEGSTYASWEYIEKNLRLTDINRLRLNILRSLDIKKVAQL